LAAYWNMWRCTVRFALVIGNSNYYLSFKLPRNQTEMEWDLYFQWWIWEDFWES
jgi:hypothetical protein